jgi:hypothetical protein
MYLELEQGTQDQVSAYIDERSSKSYTYIRGKVVSARRYYEIKKCLGWSAVIIDCIPSTMFNPIKTTEAVWRQCVKELQDRGEDIRQITTQQLQNALGDRPATGLLDGVSNFDFLSWFNRFGTAAEYRNDGALAAVLLVAARSMHLNPPERHGIISPHLQVELDSSDKLWPELGNEALGMVSRFAGYMVPLGTMSKAITPLILAPLDSILAQIMPYCSFERAVERTCNAGHPAWHSERTSFMELAYPSDVDLQIAVDGWLVMFSHALLMARKLHT